MNTWNILWRLYKLKKNTAKTPEQLKKLQEEKLHHLLRHAYDHSAYYHNLFESAGISRQELDHVSLEKIPVLDKQTLLSRFEEIVTVPNLTQEELRTFDQNEVLSREPYLGKYHIVHSSGSTGKPGYFVYDENAWSSMLVGIIRAALWGMSIPKILKFLAERPRIAFLAATDGRYGGAMAVGDGIEGVGASALNLDINTPLDEWIRSLREFNPNMVIGYPSAVKILCQLLERGELTLSISRVVTCGEPLDPGLRSYMERFFKTEIINFYGSSESLAMGVETDTREGMLLFDDMNIIEARGDEIYLTCLYNELQPLIRYRLTDRITLQEPSKDDRYPFSRAMGLLGRSEDILWFTDKTGSREFLHPLAVEGFCLEGLKDYQFVQTSADAFEMSAELAKGAPAETICNELKWQMDDILAEKRLDYVHFTVRIVERILPDPSTGKKPLIVRKLEEGEYLL